MICAYYCHGEGVMMNVLTQYEKAHLIGIRLLQLQQGAIPVSTENIHDMTMIEIAERDIQSGKLPLVLKRHSYNPNDSFFVEVLPNFVCTDFDPKAPPPSAPSHT